MQDLIQETVIVTTLSPQTINAAAGAWVNCKNHKYVTFITQIGSCTTGEQFAVFKATNKSGASPAKITEPFVGAVYYTNIASVSKASLVQTSATNLSSTSVIYDVISVAATSSTTYIATVDVTAATDDSKAYISLRGHANAMSTMIITQTAIMHGTRFGNETQWNVLA